VRALTFRERLREEAAKAAAAEIVDPWRLRLERVRGKVDFFDRLERVSSQTLLDLLEVPQRNRTAGTYRRLAKVMAQIGWSAVRVRDLTERRLPRADKRILPRSSELAAAPLLLIDTVGKSARCSASFGTYGYLAALA
jgi:hypothetical protein